MAAGAGGFAESAVARSDDAPAEVARYLGGVARQPRNVLPEAGVFHVTCRGVAKSEIFLDDSDRAFFVRLLRESVGKFDWHCHAYCLMGNHYHAILETELVSLSRGIHRMNGAYAQRFNRRYERVGHLFQNRFFARNIATDAHLESAIAYVWNNPVRAGLCEEAHHWPWGGSIRPRSQRAA